MIGNREHIYLPQSPNSFKPSQHNQYPRHYGWKRQILFSIQAKRKQIIKKEYKELMHTFKQPLMKLTVTQGKILVRLIYRETNNTSFNHIKEYKGTVNAYFWQSLALLFGNNLKADYEPNGRDREIEQVVRSIEKEAPSHISRR